MEKENLFFQLVNSMKVNLKMTNLMDTVDFFGQTVRIKFSYINNRNFLCWRLEKWRNGWKRNINHRKRRNILRYLEKRSDRRYQ